MPAFWAWFIAAGTIGFIIWCVWLILWSAKQGPQGKTDEELVGHRWDGDLEEWNNPAPKWWLYLYFITILFAIGYLVAYPGIGTYKGLLGWTEKGQYEDEVAAAEKKYEPLYERYAQMDFEKLAADPDAHKLGASLFASYCTTCHGSDARGAPGFPNLTDDAWLWGDSEAALITTIGKGRNAVMPNLSPALGGETGIDDMVHYVRSLSGLEEAGPAAMRAKPKFLAMCSACHMPDGTGNQAVGAPNLTDDVWEYGSSPETIRETITKGRTGQMPAHGQMLGENRTKILAAYIYSLSHGQ